MTTRRTRRSPKPRPSKARAALRRIARFGVVAAALGLASCAVAPSSRYPAKSDVKPHPGVAAAQDHPIHGIDLSKWQGRVDWASLRAAGTKFAFIKATEGGDHVDERFMENWHAAKRAGIPR